MKDIGEPLDAIIVPVGGGGLIAGISVAMKHLSPDTEVIVRNLYPKISILLCDVSLVLIPAINAIKAISWFLGMWGQFIMTRLHKTCILVRL